MSILDRIADDLSKHVPDLSRHVPDLDAADLGKDLQKAREAAERAVADVAGRARTLRSDVAATAGRVAGADRVPAVELPIDELGERLRALARSPGIRAAVERLERQLPDTDVDRYTRAYRRGRVQARTTFLAVGVAAGAATGVAAAYLLDPVHGQGRREVLAQRIRAVATGFGARAERAAATAQQAAERARARAAERRADHAGPGIPVMAPTDVTANPASASEPAAPHVALPPDLVDATLPGDPGEPVVRA